MQHLLEEYEANEKKRKLEENRRKIRTVEVQTEPQAKNASSQASLPDPVLVTKITELKAVIKKLEDENRGLRSNPPTLSSKEKLSIVREELLKVHSKTQVDFLLGKQVKNGRWSAEDIIRGLQFRFISRKAYQYVRAQKLLHLPGLSTLRRWVRNFNVEPGILHDSINVLKKARLQSTSANYELVSLSFDEMKLKSVISYNQRDDRFEGPHSQFQCAVIRGLCSPLKQPVFGNFDCPMTKDRLFHLLDSIWAAGYKVKCISSDQGGSNQGLWRELQVSHDNPFFFYEHEGQTHKIYVIPDAPHVIKNLRNHVMGPGGLQLPEKQVLQKSDFADLLAVDNAEYRINHKLSNLHVDCSGSSRQRVYLATQALSNSVSNTIQYLYPNDFDKLEKAKAIKIINDFFDICNSRVIKDPVSTKSAFGIDLPTQTLALKKMEDLMLSTRKMLPNKHDGELEPQTALLPCQKAAIMLCRAIPALYHDLKNEHNVKYLFTSRLNSDVMENLFSRIRSLGGTNDHPNSTQALDRLRILILGQGAHFAVKTASVNCPDEAAEDSFLTAELASSISLKVPAIEETDRTIAEPDFDLEET